MFRQVAILSLLEIASMMFAFSLDKIIKIPNLPKVIKGLKYSDPPKEMTVFASILSSLQTTTHFRYPVPLN